MFHNFPEVIQRGKKLLHSYRDEYRNIWSDTKGKRYRDRYGEYVPLDKPYQEGYFFSLTLNVKEAEQKLSYKEAEILKEIWPHFVYDYVSYEKRPAWKKTYNVNTDEFKMPAPKWEKEKEVTHHLFCWFEFHYSDRQLRGEEFGEPIPYVFHTKEEKAIWEKMRPFLTLIHRTSINWRGEETWEHYFTLDRKYRRFFSFRRWDRMITHKFVLDGARISREDYLNKKLYYDPGLVRMYDEKFHNDHDWDYGKPEVLEKVLKKDVKDQLAEIE